jgi:hypothetical protein
MTTYKGLGISIKYGDHSRKMVPESLVDTLINQNAHLLRTKVPLLPRAQRQPIHAKR